MDALPLTVNAPHKVEMKDHGKFGHTIGRIQDIDLMSIIEFFYEDMVSTFLGFQGIKHCVQSLASHPHKPIFYPYTYYDG